jgi:hypothetical protein
VATLRVLRAGVSPTTPTRLRIVRAGVTTTGAGTLRVLRAGVTTETSVQANAGAPVTGNPTGYTWTQTLGPTVTLRPGRNVPRPEFTAPATDAGTEVRFTLAVTNADGTTSTNTALAVITVRPHIDWHLAADGVTWVPDVTDVLAAADLP